MGMRDDHVLLIDRRAFRSKPFSNYLNYDHMRRKIVLLFTSVLFTISSFASVNYTIPDSTEHPGKLSKLTQQDFLDNYGTDDVSIALINYFFQLRKKKRLPLLLSGSGLMIASAGTAVLANKVSTRAGEPGALAGALLIVAACIVIIPLLIVFIISLRYFSFSKRKLYKALMDHRAGKPIAQKITRNRLYQEFLNAARMERK
jgi:hypothetical protein